MRAFNIKNTPIVQEILRSVMVAEGGVAGAAAFGDWLKGQHGIHWYEDGLAASENQYRHDLDAWELVLCAQFSWDPLAWALEVHHLKGEMLYVEIDAERYPEEYEDLLAIARREVSPGVRNEIVMVGNWYCANPARVAAR